MKILVFSDSHRSRAGMLDAIEQEKPDMVIHLGDLLSDAEEVGYVYPRLPLVSVPGNCDGWTMEPAIRRFQAGGKTFLVSHGHLWRVKQGYELAIAEARKAGADFLLFGHTHRPYCEQVDGLWVMNPGTARTSYGTILLEPNRVKCSITPMD